MLEAAKNELQCVMRFRGLKPTLRGIPCRQIGVQIGQQPVDQFLLARVQFMALAAAIEDTLVFRMLRLRHMPYNAALMASAKSVRSQLKPPSASGVRPK